MKREKKEHYKKKLLEEKSSLINTLDKITDEESMSLKDSTGELSSYDNHPADQGSNTYEREKDGALRNNTLSLLEKVNESLQKIETDKYGICQRCGERIAAERLDMVPYTSFCKDCESIEDQYIDEGDRPYNEGVTDPPFSHSFTDETDNTGYDGEDSWQDVAQYGTSNTIQDVPNDGSEDGDEAYIDADEKVGFVGREDMVFDDELDELKDTESESTTFTGKETEDNK